MKVFILAGGFGTRLGNLTKNKPKPLIEINGKPILEWIILNLKKYNLKDITISTHYLSNKILDYFGDGSLFGVSISYLFEKEPLGTGGAILEFSKNVDDKNFIVINGDNLADFNWEKIIEDFKKNKTDVLLTLNKVLDVSEFGVAKIEKNKIIDFVEKPKKEDAPSHLINSGAYIINKNSLKILPNGKSSIEKDFFEKITKKGMVSYSIHEGLWFPTDNIERLNKAKKNWKI